MDTCIICGKNCFNCELLSNGSLYHMECYNKIHGRIDHFNGKLSDVKREIHLRNQEINETHRIIYKIRLFFGSNKTDIQKLMSEISALDNGLKKLKRLIEHETNIITKLHDYWLEKPPDWDLRKDIVKDNAAHCCQRCGRKYGEKHVHHIIPISKGGNHRLDNLEYLCVKCHSRAHHGRDVSTENKTQLETKSAYAKRLKLIQQAIENDELIRFSYKKYYGEKSVRSIKPEYLEQKGKSLCVAGFCFLRNADRIFAIKRMTRVKIIGEPGKC